MLCIQLPTFSYQCVNRTLEQSLQWNFLFSFFGKSLMYKMITVYKCKEIYDKETRHIPK